MRTTQNKNRGKNILIIDIIVIAIMTLLLVHFINVKNGNSKFILLHTLTTKGTTWNVNSNNKTNKTNTIKNTVATNENTMIEKQHSEIEEFSDNVQNFLENDFKENAVFIVYVIFYVLIVINVILHNIGRFSAKLHYAYYRRVLKKSNPYKYYRELPNNFGVGVASLIVDSAIENEKDIVAVILDLCAKGYLELEKDFNNNYNIKVINSDFTDLISNEKYVIQNISNGKLRNFDYNTWFNYCKNDAISFGLIIPNGNIRNYNNQKKKKNPIAVIYKFSVLIIALGIFIMYLINGENSLGQIKEQLDMIDNPDLLNVIAIGAEIFISLFVGFFVAIPVTYLGSIIYAIFATVIFNVKSGYRSEKNNTVVLSEYGKAEVKKLFAFEAFLNDFGEFASKNPEEITLWEYYLSYAQVFGLTDKILKTGYKNIIKKGFIQVEDINSINLNKFIN